MLKKGAAVFALLGCLWLQGCQLPVSTEPADTVIEDLQVEYRRNPIGLDEEAPLFSWKMKSSERGQKQTAYQILVAESEEALKKEVYLWDSGKVTGGISVAVPYEGSALSPATRYFWTVKVWDGEDGFLETKEQAFFETGLMDSGWSEAEWISAPQKERQQEAGGTSYSIEFDFLGGNAAGGIVFGADTDRYGELYGWSFCREGETPFLKTFRLENFERKEEQQVSLEEFYSVSDLEEKWIHVQIEVDGTHAVTWMDGQQVAETQLAKAKAPGRIGLYNTRTEEFSLVDNLLVQDSTGAILYEEDFEEEDTIFSPEYVKRKDGSGCAKAGVTLVPGDDGAAPMLRRGFKAEKEVTQARLYTSALGIYQLFLNGEKVTTSFLNPGQMVYSDELEYCTYDVTDLIRSGENVLGAYLGHGWFDRAVGMENNWNPWGDCAPAFLGKLVLTYEDGTQQVIVTDEEWRVSTDGPIRRDDIYQGEFYDARLEQTGWNEPGFDAAGWEKAAVEKVDEKFRQLPFTAHERESIENTFTLEPMAVTEPQPGVLVYDFGQNFSGVCRVTLKGQPGQCITLRYAEALNEENLRNRDDAVGTIWTRNLLTASNTDYYVCKGDETEIYLPETVWRGFRYVQITGLPEGERPISVEGIVLTSGLTETGAFESSDALLNRLYQNILWTQRSNFLDTPSDCPQRDERFGWTGDAAQFSATAVYNMNARNFFRNYLEGMRLLQAENGAYPDMVPHTRTQGYGNNGWGDAGVVVTWELYQQYGDLRVVEENFDAMCDWVDYLEQTSDGYIRHTDSGYGDHLQYSSMPKDMSNTAQSAYSALLVSKMAEVLGRAEESSHYRMIYEQFRDAWRKNWMQEDGILPEGTQTAAAQGLSFALYPEELRQGGARFLTACVEWSGFQPTTGYVGTPWLLPTLTQAGYVDYAYRLLGQTTTPSWGAHIGLGATTIAESWTGYSLQEDGMYELHGSLNHFALGSIGEWFYSGILGIAPDEAAPGFKRIVLAPQIFGGPVWAQGSYESVYGMITSSWEHTETGYHYSVKIPANTTARLTLPVAGGGNFREREQALEDAVGVNVSKQTGNRLVLELESGSYDFWVE